MSRPFGASVAVAVLLLLALGNAAVAQDLPVLSGRGLRLGPVEIHPGVSVSETYSDNMFLEPDGDERWDFMTTVSPSLAVHLPLRRHSIDLEYRSEFFEFHRHNNYDVDHHLLGGRFTLDFPGGLMLRAGHTWEALSNPPTFLGDDRKRFKRHTSEVEATYTFTDRYSVSARYQHAFDRFDKAVFEEDDSDTDDVSLDLNYRILPKTTVFLRGGWTGNEYPERGPISTDSDEYRVWIGARTTPRAKIVGVLAGGWNRREWDDEAAGDPITTFGVQGDLYWDPTPRTRLSLLASRTIETTLETTTDNVAFGSSYTATDVTLGIRQILFYRLTASANVGFGFRNYSGEGPATAVTNRDDRIISVDADLKWQALRFVTVGFTYRFADNDSDVPEEDYTENQYVFYVNFRL